MKLINSYSKEMKIAARGFYFYIEIIIAIIVLLVLLYAVDENPTTSKKEFLYNDMPEEALNEMLDKDIEEGRARLLESTEWVLKPAAFALTNQDTGEVVDYDFEEEKTISTLTIAKLNGSTGKVKATAYILNTEEDMIRLAHQEKQIGITTTLGEDGRLYFQYVNQGYETDRYKDLLYVIHNEDFETLNQEVDKQVVETLGVTDRLNARQNVLPMILTFMGSLMGVFIVAAYIFLDKAEGVIKAQAVSPSSIITYLLSKTMVICTTVVVSSTIITIPVMGAGPNYPLLYLFLVVSTFAFAALGLLIASCFRTMNKSFGVLYAVMIILMLPAFSYFIPSFDPVWLRFFPTYPVLQAYKDILLGLGDYGYVWMYTGIFAAAGVLILLLANNRFKKTLMF